MKIRRNDPCPCGSGKKYKKCCGSDELNISNNYRTISHIEHFIEGILPNEDPPEFSDNFFNDLDNDEFCPYKLMYSCLLHPEIESIANSFSNQIMNRGKQEAILIKGCQTTSDLIELMKNGIDPLNHEIMRSMLLEKKEESVPQLLEALSNNVRDDFLEVSIRTIFLSDFDVSDKIMTIITDHKKTSYQISMLCILLGFYDNPVNVRFLWNYFLYFRTKLPGQKYWKGPFYGLWEIWARNKFEKEKE